MAAFRSSSRVTTPFSVSQLSAISTIPTAPSTIRERAATTALACWRRSIAYAPEIAQAMLRRQQANAVVAARSRIVEGAVGMVEMALNRLEENLSLIHI